MTDTWQEIRTEMLKQPEALRAQTVRLFAPFVFRGEVYCLASNGGGCRKCAFTEEREHCRDAPSCDAGHFEVFTPVHYAQHIARSLSGANDAGQPAESQLRE